MQAPYWGLFAAPPGLVSAAYSLAFSVIVTRSTQDPKGSVRVHLHAFHRELAQLRQEDLLQRAEHSRRVRLALDHQIGRSTSWGSRLERIAIMRSRERWQAWQEVYYRLVTHIGRGGFHFERDSELSTWVGEQQKAHRQGGLGKRRTKQLVALPGWEWHTIPFKPVTD